MSETQYNSIQTQIESVKESLPDECLTPGVKAQLVAIESQIVAQKTACESAVNAEKKLKELWKGIAIVMTCFLFFSLIKRI